MDVRDVRADGTIIQIRVWQVPEPVPPSEHRFKYSLFFGRPGERVVAFDNERGKGDHFHLRDVERPYVFQGIDRLLDDFAALVRETGGQL